MRVYTLGRFRVEVAGEPLRHAGREPRQPLALLKALVALGGEGVPAEHLCDWLWPESDGDLAAKALSVTLVRLRRLIGAESLRVHNARISLVPEFCWADAIACDALLEPSR